MQVSIGQGHIDDDRYTESAVIDIYDIDGLIRSFRRNVHAYTTVKVFLTEIENIIGTSVDDFEVFSKRGDFLRNEALLRNGFILDGDIYHIQIWLNRDTTEVGLRRRVEVKGRCEMDEELIAAYQMVNSNKTEFTCSICFGQVQTGDGIVLVNCLHEICKDCIDGVAKATDDGIIRCPVSIGENQCNAVLSPMEVRSVCSPKVLTDIENKTIRNFELTVRAFHCLTNDCPGFDIVDVNDGTFECSVCLKPNCSLCLSQHDFGISCKDYMEVQKFQEQTRKDLRRTSEQIKQLIESGDTMRCPKCSATGHLNRSNVQRCRILIQKRGGCDGVVCTACHTTICWITKQSRWGPGGTGDTSGGCRCMVNGIKCHPSCRNCH